MFTWVCMLSPIFAAGVRVGVHLGMYAVTPFCDRSHGWCSPGSVCCHPFFVTGVMVGVHLGMYAVTPFL